MIHRIEWCIWQPGVDDADQCWTEAVPNAGVDLSSRASCEAEVRALDYDGEGRYTHRVVEVEDAPESARPPQKTTVDRWLAREQRWVQVETEIAS